MNANKRLEHLRDQSRKELEHGLVFLRARVDAMLANLKQGKAIDDHLLTNSAGLTKCIAQYNTAVELLPYLGESDG